MNQTYPPVPMGEGVEQPTIYYCAGMRNMGDIALSCLAKLFHSISR